MPRRRRGRRRGGRWRWLFAAAVGLFALLRTVVAEACHIPSASMAPTLLAGDYLLVHKLRLGARLPWTERRLPGWGTLRHDDVVVFAWPVDPARYYVKRVVGLPGDRLAMRAGQLERNGRPVPEPWVARTSGPDAGARDTWGPLIVPARHLFVLGDQRDASLDSRSWGFVPERLLIGVPWRLYFSVAPPTAAAVPVWSRVRWARIGRAVP